MRVSRLAGVFFAMIGHAAAASHEPIAITVPPGWQRVVETAPFSRTWRLTPDAVTSDTFRDGKPKVNVLLTVHFDAPQDDVTVSGDRLTAESMLDSMRFACDEHARTAKQSTATAAKLAGQDGFECTFTEDDGRIVEVFGAIVKPFVLFVTLSHRSDHDPAQLAAGRAARESLVLDLGIAALAQEIAPFHDALGAVVVKLPKTWQSKRHSSLFGARSLLISPDPIKNDVDTGCVVSVWSDFSRMVPKDETASEAPLEMLIALAGREPRKGYTAVERKPTALTIGGIEGRRIEAAHGPDDGVGPTWHSLHWIGPAGDALIHVSFRATEIEWPGLAPLFERALADLELNLSEDARDPRLPNSETGRFGDALLLADLLAPALPTGCMRATEVAPGATVLWQTFDAGHQVTLSAADAPSARDYVGAFQSRVPRKCSAVQRFLRDLGKTAAEVGMDLTTPEREWFVHIVAVDAAPGRVLVLELKHDAKDAGGVEAFAPLVDVVVKRHPALVIAKDGGVTFTMPGLRARFLPPKSWHEGFDRCRSVITFKGTDGFVALEVRPPEAVRSDAWQGDEAEQRMAALAIEGKIDVLADKAIAGGKGGQDREVTRVITTAGGARTWERTRVLHRAGGQVKLVMQVGLQPMQKVETVEKTAGPVFSSLKVDAG